jgi:hypothetical protein
MCIGPFVYGNAANGISFWILYHDAFLLSAKISNRIESFVVLLGANPAIRCNLLCRTPAQKDFHCYRGYDFDA